MQLVEYYHRMQVELAGASEEVSVTLEELAGILYCSERNVKIILKKMSDLGWIRWKPGRGRGNRSTLELLQSSDALLLEEARQYVKDGHLKAAMELVNLRGFQTAKKEEFLEWLYGYFGYQEIGEREKRLDTLRLPFYTPILTLDPAEMLFAKDLHLVKQIFDTLVRYDPADRKIKPHLAHFWESDRDGRVWTFYLRKGVRFHHGRELTAEDAVFTLERLRQREQTATNGWLAEPIGEVRALSPYVVRVELKAPNYMFLHYACAGGMSILPKDIYGQGAGAGNLDRYPIGTGAFRVTRHDDCVCVLDAFQDYFLGRALLDRVEIWIMPGDCRRPVDPAVNPIDVAGPAERLDVDTFTHCDGNQDETGRCRPDFKTVTMLEQGCTLLVFNMKRDGPQRSRSFREAVHLLLDRGAMARELGNGDLFPASGFLPPDPPLTEDPGYRPEEGRRLLRESGYAGETLRLYMTSKHEPKGSWLADRLREAGIRVEMEFVTRHEAGITEKMLEADCFLGGVVADDDLDLSLLEMYKVGNMPIRTYLDEVLKSELKRRIEAILQEPSATERPLRIRELETCLKRDCYALFLLHPICKTTFSSVVNGISLNSLGMVNFKDLWFQPSHQQAQQVPS